MDDNQQSQDSLFEEISVATAIGISGAAFFLHEGSFSKLEDIATKSKIYLSEYSRFLGENIDDITQINAEKIRNVRAEIAKKIHDTNGISTSYHPTDSKMIRNLHSLYGVKINGSGIMNQLYTNEIRKQALSALDRAEDVSENVYAAIIDNLDSFTMTFNDREGILKELSKRLSKDTFEQSLPLINNIIEKVDQWKQENKKEEWIKNHKSVLNQYQEKIFDVDQLLAEQQKEREGIISKLDKDHKVTIDRILDILQGNDEKEKKRIRTLLDKDSLITLESEKAVDALDIQDKKQRDVIKNEINQSASKDTSGSYRLTTTELIKIEFDKIQDPEKKEKFKKLEIDNLYIDDDTKEIYSRSDSKQIEKKVAGKIFDLFPFKMLRGQDFLQQQNAAVDSYLFKVGNIDSVVAEATGSQDIIDKQISYINDRYYYLDDDMNMHHIESLDDTRLLSSRTGIIKQIDEYGNMRKPTKDDSPLGLRLFNRKQEADSDIDVAMFQKFDKETSEKVFAVRLGRDLRDPESIRQSYNMLNNFGMFKKELDKTTYLPSLEGLKNIYNKLDDSDDDKKYLKYIFDLEEDPENLDKVINQIAGMDNMSGLENISNPYLSKVVQRYAYDPIQIRKSFHNTKKDPYSLQEGRYISYSYKETLQQELAAEFFARKVSDEGLSSVLKTVKQSFQGMKKDEVTELIAGREYLRRLGLSFIHSDNEGSTGREFEKLSDGILDLINSNDKDSILIKEIVSRHFSTFGRDIEEYSTSSKDKVYYRTSNRMAIKKMNIPTMSELKDILNDINSTHFEKAAEKGGRVLTDFLMQFVSGPGNGKHFTSASIAPYYLLNRLHMGLKGEIPFTNYKYDFTLNSRDTRTTKDLIKNFGLKRVAPVIGAVYAFNALDDLYKGTTNMGLEEAGVSGAANTYLGIKKAADVTGISGLLKGITKDNVISAYLADYTGEDDPEWNSYEEQKKYYEEGYTAIRKGRFWTFGSSNELRGAGISYYEANSLRTLMGDYKDMSLYGGSYLLKYNPYRLLDPYYLEKLHSEDRPYPVSGSFFEENTPWGAVLNPTIGEIIKPKVLLHSDRLSDDGVDVKALIYHMNAQAREKANSGMNNMIILDRGKLKAMDFMAYNAPTYSDRIITMDTDDKRMQLNDYSLYNTPIRMDNEVYQAIKQSNAASVRHSEEITFGDEVRISAAKGNPYAQLASYMVNSTSLNIIKEQNNQILAKAGYDKSQGIMLESKIHNQESYSEKILNDAEHIADLVYAGQGNDFIHEMAVSTRMVTGLYGWGISNLTGFGDNKNDRIATSADMYSYSRDFWDSGVGGAGGEIMEITRRFIPEYRRFQTYNPLMNTMPDWMPERFRFGDPYTAVPNGEARLPGLGYESMNVLHSDIYGRYGAFDRFKILADIAPYSAEYKFWRNVAEKTISDPDLLRQMEDIKKRTQKQSKQHDFYNYKYVGRDLDRRNAYVTEVGKNGEFKIYGSDRTYKLAGVKVSPNANEDSQAVLERYIQPGQLVNIGVDTNEAYATDSGKNRAINAAVFINDENVSSLMLANGDATKRENDTSTAAYMGDHNALVNTMNYLAEGLAHTNFSIIHNRFLRVNDPLEDYKDEYLYGTSFQTWDSPIESYILPSLKEAADSSFLTGMGIATDIVRNNYLNDTKRNAVREFLQDHIKKDGPLKFLLQEPSKKKWAVRAVKSSQFLFDRGAMVGSLVGEIALFGSSKQSTLKNTSLRRWGSAASLAFSAVAAPEDLGVSIMSWSRLGYLTANEFMGGKKRWLASAIGAGIGLARNFGSIKLLGDEHTDSYIPDSARKRWEMQDYFDRLNYVKYMALYNKAADEAEDEEDVDIRSILERQDQDAKQINETKKEIYDHIRELKEEGTSEASRMIEELNLRLANMEVPKVPLTGGDYTKSAVMYYNAAKATMYGLSKQSQLEDIIRALPKTEREYFIEFQKEKDPEKRKEILSYVSPFLQKALKLSWYGELEKPESNESFFETHNLPSPIWSGWNPQVDLADIEAKVIKNEGMEYADFGVYASQYKDPDVANAPDLKYSADDSLITTSLKLQTILSGLGLTGVEVNVEPAEDSAIQVVANVVRVVPYSIEESIYDMFGVN